MRLVVQSAEQDRQRERLYAMEFRELRGLWHGTRTAPKTLQRHVRRVCRLYGLPVVSLQFRTIESKGLYIFNRKNGLPGLIRLDPQWGRNAITLAHELAHYVTHMKFPKTRQDHGPRFVRVYAEITYILRLVPLEGFKAICRKHGVRMARGPA